MKQAIFIITLLFSFDIFSQKVGINTTSPEGLLHLKGGDWIKTLYENGTGQPRAYVGVDNNGTMTLASNAYWNGSAWVYPFSGSSMYMLLHRGNNRYEWRVRPEAGSQNVAMTLDLNGRLGVGLDGANPQENLSVGDGLSLDQNNGNVGSITNSLRFGSNSGEGIGSKRSAGTGQFGLDFYTNSTRRLSIANNGNIGIGVAAPAVPLEFAGSIGEKISLAGNGANHYGLGLQNNVMQLYSPAATSIAFGNGSSSSFFEKMRLNSQGVFQLGADPANPKASISSLTGNILANNLPAFVEMKKAISVFIPTNSGLTGNINLASTTVTIPAAGVLYVEAGFDNPLYSLPGTSVVNPDFELKLDEALPGGGFINIGKYDFQLQGLYPSTAVKGSLALTGAGSKTLSLYIYKNSDSPGGQINEVYFRIWYYPNVLSAN